MPCQLLRLFTHAHQLGCGISWQDKLNLFLNPHWLKWNPHTLLYSFCFRYCSYFDEINEVYDYKPNTTFINPNIRSRAAIEEQLESATVDASLKRPLLEATMNCTRPYKAKRLTALQEKVESTELLQAVTRMHNELKAIEMEKIKLARQMHEEKVALFTKLLEVMQK